MAGKPSTLSQTRSAARRFLSLIHLLMHSPSALSLIKGPKAQFTSQNSPKQRSPKAGQVRSSTFFSIYDKDFSNKSLHRTRHEKGRLPGPRLLVPCGMRTCCRRLPPTMSCQQCMQQYAVCSSCEHGRSLMLWVSSSAASSLLEPALCKRNVVWRRRRLCRNPTRDSTSPRGMGAPVC